mmetsp:Transcript_29407/g.48566  ORF Transcript_29407/g.48566 Transcript_29407/m.48566 type:complete len:410 (+) Transcript_29407:72-1301(+)|eukprot:CAMPEP_0119023522 /NCGR_PEP_ID=MMETSP1176-20130426/30105_1 /TAXON_ID=265551 /ORGANISM="Synedropsis recta cf, Strain CCMP1620" /LENGTH=409 /DNA_ID=CAMNT_0006978611 /DNA_START=33 /DNA_END=1262 /DNA_ORIENTATION=+
MSDNDKKKQYDEQEAPPMPTFSGNVMPMNVAIDVEEDDIGEETTRRIGGGGFNPSFNSTFEPVSFATQNFAPGSSVSTAPVKAAAVVVTATPSPPATKGGWELDEAPILPEFHPLDRASVFVPHSRAATVAQRISEVLRDRSIEAHFDNTKAKARCLTTYNVDFRVFLYRGQKQYSHGTIVEVQRRNGASVLFVQDTQAILEAAQGKIPPPPPPLGSAEIPLVSDSEDDYDQDDATASLSSLDFVAKMLAFQGYGPNLLALQTLSSLTDPAKMGISTSKKVSEALAQPNNTVGAKVFAIIVDKNSSEEQEGLRLLSMTVLSHVLQTTNGNIIAPMRETLRPVLLRELSASEKNPQMSYLACKCLEPLLQKDHAASDFYSALDSAQSIGEARHAGLRDQAEKCIRMIDSL